MGYSPNDFEELRYPEQIVNSVKRVKIAKTFKKKIDDKIKKREILKKRFEDYYENYVNYLQLGTDLRIPEIRIKIFNPLDYQVAYLTKMAYKILDSKDFKTEFWREILGKIYIGLIEYQYVEGSNAKYYNQTEKYFLLLLKKLINYKKDIVNIEDYLLDNDYLLDDDLYELLIQPLLNNRVL